MAFKLTKKESDRRTELVKDLLEKASDVENAVIAYNSILSDAKEFVEEVHGRLESEYDDKGDNWHEKSTKAEGAQSMIEEWSAIEVEELDNPTMDHAENLAALMEEAE